MDETELYQRPSWLSEINGQIPLAAMVWFETHPTAWLATALSLSSSSIRWHFRLGNASELVLRGNRVETIDPTTNARLGSAKIVGVRSAADFDRLPKATESPPFRLPEPTYPTSCGFACDLDGQVARFHPSDGPTGPGLAPRHTSYPDTVPVMEELLATLQTSHDKASYPVVAFAARVKDLVTVLGDPQFVGSGRFYPWFDDERVVVWPAGVSETAQTIVSMLHTKRMCLGCSKFDPRDPLSYGTYSYSRAPYSQLSSYSRDHTPLSPLDVRAVAQLLGRSPAELAATALPIRFKDALKVVPTQVRRAD